MFGHPAHGLMVGGLIAAIVFVGAVVGWVIPLGRGVCGTAAGRRETVVVRDVREFPGHIACDPASRSEIVVPLISDGDLLGVLDVDAPEPGRFDQADRAGLERLAAVLVPRVRWAALREEAR